MSTTAQGRAAERIAVRFLKARGFAILTTNWRTRWCEIDIVAQKTGVVYAVEVKYRGSLRWGSGLDYITPNKLRQMQFAAAFWVAKHRSQAAVRLGAIELTGQPPVVTAWLDDI